jgi:membrane peptidoglycan carboxypeptidase
MHRSLRRRWLWLALAALVSAGASVAMAAWFASPMPSTLAAHVHSRLQRTHAKVVPLDAIAPILREAVVATEDERFYRHHGIDLLGVLRALPYDAVHLSFSQGASTITEQVAKLLYLQGNDHTPWRKLEDAALALKLEDRYGKDQILSAYLNSAYFGEGAYGARAASERYFGIAPRRLGPAQASLLAGLIQAPSAYDPRLHPQLARARQAEVLRSLVRDGFLTEGEAAAAIDEPLHLFAGPPLPALHGVDLSPGPAFVWWELALGAITASLGVVLLVASRLPRFRFAYGVVAVRALSLALALLGAGAIVRSFRAV